MIEWPRVVLLLNPLAGYDRQVLEGVVRYGRAHGPWIFHVAGVEAGLPLPSLEAVNGPLRRIVPVSEVVVRLPDLRRWGVTGIIGRLQSPRVAKTVVAAGVPLVAMNLSMQQIAEGLSAEVSELRPIPARRPAWLRNTFWNKVSRVSAIAVSRTGSGRIVAGKAFVRGWRRPASIARCITPRNIARNSSGDEKESG